MWPHEKLKILVPRTPPDPPLPPLTPPRGPGGPKMAKMHSLKSIDDNLCQKSHFWGVKKIDLFFHSECTRRVIVPRKEIISPGLTWLGPFTARHGLKLWAKLRSARGEKQLSICSTLSLKREIHVCTSVKTWAANFHQWQEEKNGKIWKTSYLKTKKQSGSVYGCPLMMQRMKDNGGILTQSNFWTTHFLGPCRSPVGGKTRILRAYGAQVVRKQSYLRWYLFLTVLFQVLGKLLMISRVYLWLACVTDSLLLFLNLGVSVMTQKLT